MNLIAPTLRVDKKSVFKETLCSACGLCQIRAWPAKESFQSCVFELGWLGEAERDLYGRERDISNPDELAFGITQERFVAALKPALDGAQWSGIITRIAQKAFETNLVEAVATLHRSKVDYFFPEPVLAQSTEDILASKGNKPVTSPTLKSLEVAYQKGVKRLLVIGASCHIHVLRDFQKRFPYLADIEVFALGIPCVDNIKPKKLRWILSRISKSHETVRHYEFMQDFTVHLKHESGDIEKVPYFSLPQELSRSEVFAPSCMSCFDYLNSLSDLTVGYVGAPLVGEEKRQWILVRTEKGKTLLNLVRDELQLFPETRKGDCTKAVKQSASLMIERMKNEHLPPKTGRRIPLWLGKFIARVMNIVGFKGTEFARYSVDFHLIRNYYFVKLRYPEKLKTLVPKHVYAVLKKYGFEP
ncbi:MAG: Coenzyme F420 hydrogenase/dehydrogenase, beta subunit C-terminal domain [Chlorobiales bacterium]